MTTLDPKMQSQTGGTGANIVGGGIGDGPGPDLMAASTLDGTKVMSSDGEHIGKYPTSCSTCAAVASHTRSSPRAGFSAGAARGTRFRGAR